MQPPWHRFVFSGRRSNAGNAPLILILTTEAGDKAFYAQLSGHGWNIALSESLPEALGLLRSRFFSVFVYDRDVAGGDWRGALRQVVECAPGIRFLLISNVCDEFLWREVVQRGGYDVLVRPLAEPSVGKMLERAIYYGKSALK